MSRWFRFYAEVAHDPKVQLLEPDIFKAWVTILCLACERGGPLPSLREIAFTLRVTEMQADNVLQVLRVTGLIDDDGENMVPHNWNSRQYIDRTNAERQKKFRQKQSLKKERARNALRPVTTPLHNARVTRSDTDTDTENRKKETRASAPPFPMKGTIEYTPWAKLCRQHAPGPDPDFIAGRFRSFMERKGIRPDDPTIEKTFISTAKMIAKDVA